MSNSSVLQVLWWIRMEEGAFPETFDKKDRRKLSRFERKEKDEKFTNELNQELQEFFWSSLKSSETITIDGTNYDSKTVKDAQFLTPKNGRIEIKTITNIPTETKTGYDQLMKKETQWSLWWYIEQYNSTISNSKKEEAEVKSELWVYQHESRFMEWDEDFMQLGRDMSKKSWKIDKKEWKFNNRKLEEVEDEEDEIKDQIKEYLKTNHKDLNKKERKKAAALIFNQMTTKISATKTDSYTINLEKESITITWSDELMGICARVMNLENTFDSSGTDKKSKKLEWDITELHNERQQLYSDYIDLYNGKNIIIWDEIWRPITDNEKVIFLLSDVNFDGQLKRAKDLQDFKRNWLWKIFVEWVLWFLWATKDKVRDGFNFNKYAKSFNGVPINNTMETQIKEWYLVAKTRLWWDDAKIYGNMKNLLRKWFPDIPEDRNVSTAADFIALLKENLEYSIYLKRVLISESDIIPNIFQHGPKAIEEKYLSFEKQKAIIWFKKWPDEIQKDVDVYLNGTNWEAKPDLNTLVKDEEVDKVIKDLNEKIKAEKDEWKKKKLQELRDELNTTDWRQGLKLNLAWGWLMLLFAGHYRGANWSLAYYDKEFKLPIRTDAQWNQIPKEEAYDDDGNPKAWTLASDPTREDDNAFRDKLKRTTFSYGIGAGGTIASEENGRYKQSFTYGLSTNYTDYRNNDPQKFDANGNEVNPWSFGVSLWYNGSLWIGKSIGNTDFHSVNFNYGVWLAWWFQKWNKPSFSPYIYAGPDVLLNKNKLTNTVDKAWSTRINAWISGSLSKWIGSFLPGLWIGNDKIEWAMIIEDNLKTTLSPVITNILLGLKSNTDIKAWLSALQYQTLQSFDENLAKSRAKNKQQSVELLQAELSLYNLSGIPADKYDEFANAEAPEIARRFANQWWNKNMESLKWLQLTSANVWYIFLLALFGFAPTTILWAVKLFTVALWSTTYSRAVAENEAVSQQKAEQDINYNLSAKAVFDEKAVDRSKEKLWIGHSQSIQIIKNTLVQKWFSQADADAMIKLENGFVILDAKVAKALEVRVHPDASNFIQTLTWWWLKIPADLAGWVSDLVYKNNTKTILSIGFKKDITDKALLSSWKQWQWTDAEFSGSPETFDWFWNYNISYLNSKLDTFNSTLQKDFDFYYDAADSDKLKIKSTSEPAATITDNGIAYKDGESLDKKITLIKNTDEKWIVTYTTSYEDLTPAWVWLTLAFVENKTEVSAETWENAKDVIIDNKLENALPTDFETFLLNQYWKNKHSLVYYIIYWDRIWSLTNVFKPLKKNYDLFSVQLDKLDFVAATNTANAIISQIKKLGWAYSNVNYSFSAGNPASLFEFAKVFIKSSGCDCEYGSQDWNTEYTFNKEWKKGLSGLIEYRKMWFERRAKGSFWNAVAQDLLGLRASSFTGVNANSNINTSYEYDSFDWWVWLVFGYPEDASYKNKLEQKLNYSPRYLKWSEKTVSNIETKKAVWKSLNEKQSAISSDWLTEEIQQEWVHISWKEAEIKVKLANWEDYITDNLKISAEYQFFLYPDCANEGVVMKLKVQKKKLESKPWTPIEEPVPPLIAWPIGFFENDASVMQRAEVAAVNIWASAALTTTPGTITGITTDPQLEYITTIPEIRILVDGEIITIPLAPWNGKMIDLWNGFTLWFSFQWYDDNGKPSWFINFIRTSDFETISSYNNFGELTDFNGTGVPSAMRNMIPPDLQAQLLAAEKSYTDQYATLFPTKWPEKQAHVLTPTQKQVINQQRIAAHRKWSIIYKLDHTK